jgi:hypothetical protein
VVKILNDLEAGYPLPIWGLHYMSGGVVERDRQHLVSDPTVVVRQVCAACNNGWMSDLEEAVTEKLGAMIRERRISRSPARKGSRPEEWACCGRHAGMAADGHRRPKRGHANDDERAPLTRGGFGDWLG